MLAGEWVLSVDFVVVGWSVVVCLFGLIDDSVREKGSVAVGKVSYEFCAVVDPIKDASASSHPARASGRLRPVPAGMV